MLSRDSSDAAWAGHLRAGWFAGGQPSNYRLTRFAFLRGLGFIYYVAFASLANDLSGLLLSRGILPVQPFMRRMVEYAGSKADAFWSLPSIFWLDHSDLALELACGLGLGLGLVVLAGYANAWMLALLWALTMSFVHVGQIFFGYGWEILLLETGFLAIFLAPLRHGSPAAPYEPSSLVIVLLRWTLFRLMFGAGLIKLRGDACWVELTCLIHHYETQPNPHPLSWLLNQAPLLFHEAGVLLNHFVELVVPWGYFGPRRVRHAAGMLTVLFQATLILSGNLSFLNWLTIVVAFSCFDDTFWSTLLPHRVVERLGPAMPRPVTPGYVMGIRVFLVLLVSLLSLGPIANMLSARQRMNASFDPLHLVNTYGAFGSVGKVRHEVVLEGTLDTQLGPHTEWREYEFPCKPGNVNRAPCLITPFHRRLDWQMWFAALSDYQHQPWIVSLVYHLLRGDESVLGLLARNPFPEHPPRTIRARLYEYHFTRFGEPGWWSRKLVGEYLKPLSLKDQEFLGFLQRFGWLLPEDAPGATARSGQRSLRGRSRVPDTPSSAARVLHHSKPNGTSNDADP